jgi:uncharacterized protein YndB with AHSA1/START domain
MANIRLSVSVDAPRRRVWADLADIASHAEWMQDAQSIRFTSARRTGVGTELVCRTRVGPLRLDDRMVVTEWRPYRAMAIRHAGVVTGTGRVTLGRPRRRPGGRRAGRTRLTWHEQLSFPWWMGGPVGAATAAPVLARIWRKNLDAFARRFT